MNTKGLVPPEHHKSHLVGCFKDRLDIYFVFLTAPNRLIRPTVADGRLANAKSPDIHQNPVPYLAMETKNHQLANCFWNTVRTGG